MPPQLEARSGIHSRRARGVRGGTFAAVKMEGGREAPAINSGRGERI